VRCNAGEYKGSAGGVEYMVNFLKTYKKLVMINVSYPHILDLIKDNRANGRTDSAAFLIWYLENYLRLEEVTAIDSVCDQPNDKGIDGIYINEDTNTLMVFQSKLSQNEKRLIGDAPLREFAGTLTQFDDPQTLEALVKSAGKANVASLVTRLDLINKINALTVKGVFVANINLDQNGSYFINNNPNNNIVFIGKDQLETEYISDQRSVRANVTMEFDISDTSMAKHYADYGIIAFIAPIKSTELVQMDGIADQSIFDYNVRGPLGNTSINKSIVRSIKDPLLHKSFPLFHNGITIVAESVSEKEGDKIEIKDFYVVNGCQSLRSCFKTYLRAISEIGK
jgi:hypothetical protein